MDKIQQDFEAWIGNPFSLDKIDPAVWGFTKEALKQWEAQPYKSPYTNGAYKAWRYLHDKA